MNFVSSELSKELQELSGWTDAGRESGIERYTLGFLLRNLPKQSGIMCLDGGYMALCDPTFSDLLEDNIQYQFLADTPEDAVAKLFCELFRQNILKSEAA